MGALLIGTVLCGIMIYIIGFTLYNDPEFKDKVKFPIVGWIGAILFAFLPLLNIIGFILAVIFLISHLGYPDRKYNAWNRRYYSNSWLFKRK